MVKKGSATAAEIYLSVGHALSWWEASEDMLQNLFEILCGDRERVGRETFSIAPRASRRKMILSAMATYSEHIRPEQASSVRDALKQLDKLAVMRNEIAHGYVSERNSIEDGHVTMQGNFLISTVTPSDEFASRQLNAKYAHTAQEIDEWCQKVRDQRGVIMDCWVAIAQRSSGQSHGSCFPAADKAINAD